MSTPPERVSVPSLDHHPRPSGEEAAGENLDHLPRIGQFLSELDRLGFADFLARHPTPALLFAAGAVPRARGAFATERSDDHPVDGTAAKTAVAWVARRSEARVPRYVWVGRDPRYDVWLPFSGVSKRHAGFFARPDGTWALTDAGSLNGTAVNGAAIVPGRSRVLADGDRVRFGGLEALFLTAESFLDELHRIRRAVDALRLMP